MGKTERKHEVITHEWMSLRVLWDQCKKSVTDKTESEAIEGLFSKGEKIDPSELDYDAWNCFNQAEQRVGLHLTGDQLRAEYLSQLELARTRRLVSLSLHEHNKELFAVVVDPPTCAQREAYRSLLYHLQAFFAHGVYHRKLRRHTATRLAIFGALALLFAAGPLLVLWLCAVPGPEAWGDQLLNNQPASLHFIVAGFGILGACFSRVTAFQARLAMIEFDEVMNLYHWRMMVVRLLIGLIAALVFYWVLRAGLVGGTLFPRLATVPQQSATEPTAELAKLVVWSFIAGFSERLVPDTLRRTEAQSEPRSS